MIKAYLTAIPSLYEGEDIAISYCILQDGVCLKKEALSSPYVKPALVGQTSVLLLLRGLERYKNQEITVFINDASLYQVLRGNSTTKNPDIIKMAGRITKQLGKFNTLSFVNVTADKTACAEWKKQLEE